MQCFENKMIILQEYTVDEAKMERNIYKVGQSEQEETQLAFVKQFDPFMRFFAHSPWKLLYLLSLSILRLYL